MNIPKSESHQLSGQEAQRLEGSAVPVVLGLHGWAQRTSLYWGILASSVQAAGGQGMAWWAAEG